MDELSHISSLLLLLQESMRSHCFMEELDLTDTVSPSVLAGDINDSLEEHHSPTLLKAVLHMDNAEDDKKMTPPVLQCHSPSPSDLPEVVTRSPPTSPTAFPAAIKDSAAHSVGRVMEEEEFKSQ